MVSSALVLTRETLPTTATDLEHATAILRRGGVVSFPTETVYGLGADAANEGAVREIFRLKGRPANHPVIVHLPSATQLERWAKDVPDTAWRLAEAFWPGPLTLILRRQPWVSNALTGAQETVGVRVPAHPLALSLLARFGGGVAAPSANRFGHISPTTAEHVRAEFGGAVPVLDGGAAKVGLESTILDLSSGAPRILRPGVVSAAMLAEVLQMSIEEPDLGNFTETSPRVSGSLKRHYAPHTPAFLVKDAAAHSCAADAVLSRRPQIAAAKVWLTLPDNPEGYGRALYAALRDLDASSAARILVETVPDTPVWRAVQNRLTRATEANLEEICD